MKKKLKILNFIGIGIGVAGIIIGIILATYSDGMFGMRQSIQFGGDFYTEIYDIVEQTRFSVMEVGHAISQLVNAVGYGFILFGILDIVVFLKQLLKDAESTDKAETSMPIPEEDDNETTEVVAVESDDESGVKQEEEN